MRAICQTGYGQKILTVLANDDTPFYFRIQREKMLNYDEVVGGRITQKNGTLRGYFIETDKNLPVFAPSRESYGIGQRVTVRITKEARLGKDATGQIVTDDLMVGLPDIRTGLPVEINTIDDDMDNLTDEWIADALVPTVDFGKGAKLHIERTQSCWCMDVDSASSGLPLEEINKCACDIVYRQIVLKNMAGVILVDFAGFKKPFEQKQIEQRMKKLFKADNRTTVYGFSKTKLFEIKRTRTTASLPDMFLTKEGNKHPLALTSVIMRDILRCKNGKIQLILHPALLPCFPENINMYCTVCPDVNVALDYYELKESK